MSDLLVTYEGLALPPKACSEEPPPEAQAIPDKKSAKKDPVPAPDGCSIQLPLVAADDSGGQARYLRFDRKKDHFVLSTNNTADNLTWVGKQSNLAELLDILRVLEATLRKAEVESVDVYAMKLSIIQHLVTGRVVLHGSEAKNLKRSPTEVDLAERTLEIVSISSDQAIANFIGPINVFRADASLSEKVKDRIRFLNQILDLKPKYRSLRAHFADPVTLDKWLELKGEERKKYQDLLAFLRQTVIHEALGKPLRYDLAFDASYRAYLAIHFDLDEKTGKDAYCKAMEKGLAELRGKRGVPKEWIQECRAAIDWSGLSETEALTKSLRFSFLSDAARPLLEQAIEAESNKANMKVDWLADRGRFAAAYRLLEEQIKVQAEGEKPGFSLDPDALRVQLNIWVGANLIKRREYILAALALLRRTFGESGSPAPVRVFHRGQFVQAEWRLDAKALAKIRDYQAELERDLKVSQTRSDVWLPAAEGATCAAGVVGLGFSEGFGGLDSRPDLKLGLGATSAGLAGAGCSSLLGHYVFPKFGKVRNRYLWEGLTGAAGAALGVGFYFLARSLRGDRGDPTKFPVDEYGP
ncbi:MAG TPA: hypothetical protein VJR29_09130 [bacterium]|nr:hypothetical protein [bacterium]